MNYRSSMVVVARTKTVECCVRTTRTRLTPQTPPSPQPPLTSVTPSPRSTTRPLSLICQRWTRPPPPPRTGETKRSVWAVAIPALTPEMMLTHNYKSNLSCFLCFQPKITLNMAQLFFCNILFCAVFYYY